MFFVISDIRDCCHHHQTCQEFRSKLRAAVVYLQSRMEFSKRNKMVCMVLIVLSQTQTDNLIPFCLNWLFCSAELSRTEQSLMMKYQTFFISFNDFNFIFFQTKCRASYHWKVQVRLLLRAKGQNILSSQQWRPWHQHSHSREMLEIIIKRNKNH